MRLVVWLTVCGALTAGVVLGVAADGGPRQVGFGLATGAAITALVLDRLYPRWRPPFR
jgi:hypothetical protein